LRPCWRTCWKQGQSAQPQCWQLLHESPHGTPKFDVAQARDELQQPLPGRERPQWMGEPHGEAPQSQHAHAAAHRPPTDDAVSSRLAALRARLAAEKSKSSSWQADHRRRGTMKIMQKPCFTWRVLQQLLELIQLQPGGLLGACRPTGASVPPSNAQTTRQDSVLLTNGAQAAQYQLTPPTASAAGAPALAGSQLPHVCASCHCSLTTVRLPLAPLLPFKFA
jgi:hypothetical protein